MIDRPTTCGLCSCGCAVYVEPKHGRVSALSPSVNHPVSTGRLCIKGWNAIPALSGCDRLRTPLIRRSGSLQTASWKEAIDLVCTAIKKTDPQNVGVIGSSKLTNEECYSLVKLARSVIGTPNIDGSSRFYDASAIPALLETTGVPAAQAGYGVAGLRRLYADRRVERDGEPAARRLAHTRRGRRRLQGGCGRPACFETRASGDAVPPSAAGHGPGLDSRASQDDS